jgi:hypothetical protein
MVSARRIRHRVENFRVGFIGHSEMPGHAAICICSPSVAKAYLAKSTGVLPAKIKPLILADWGIEYI